MTRLLLLVAIAWALALFVPGCRKPADPAPVAVTNSLLECAARDLLGPDTPVLCLAEPGMCPGHFDVRPSQVEALRRCRVLLRLDFQKSLDGRLSSATDQGLRIVEVRIAGGLAEPDSYLAACRQTADALVAAGLLERSAADARLSEIAARVRRLADACRERLAPLQDTPVLTSSHQEAFCRWLGLRVAGTFTGADSAGVGQINDAIRLGEQAGAKLVIANLPEGRRVADALAEHLGAKVVVLGNFPAAREGGPSFDELLLRNVNALAEATRQ